MKKTLSFIALVAGLLSFGSSVTLAQVYPTTIMGLTNANIATVAANSAVTTTNIITLTKNCGLSFQPNFNVSSGTSAMLFYLYETSDGTNYSTAPWAIVSATATGTTTVTTFTNWTANQLAGIVALNVGIVTNNNAGTFTNKATVFNRVSYNQ